VKKFQATPTKYLMASLRGSFKNFSDAHPHSFDMGVPTAPLG